MKDVTELIKDYCSQKDIPCKGAILHGSQAVGFANRNSDYDFLIITDSKTGLKIDTFIDNDNRKIQLEFMDTQALEKELASYEKVLFDKMSDLNLMAGRVFMGKILAEEDFFISRLIKVYRPYQHKKKLIEKFFYQAVNFYSDSKTDDLLLKEYSLDLMVKAIGTAYLIYKDVYWLNIKWQHRFMERFLEPKEYEYYIRLRLNRQDMTEDIVSAYAKELLGLINLSGKDGNKDMVRTS